MALAAQLPTVVERSHSRLWGIPVYWHLLSLDAPTVAVLWALTFAQAAGVHAPITALAVLGIGTWLIYVADRLLDNRAADASGLRERHFFHAKHRRPLLVASAAAAVALVSLIIVMPAAARRADTIVFAASMLYFVIVHTPVHRIGRRMNRELAVGIVFGCATAIPAWSPSTTRILAAPVLLFAALCCLNCIAIETWEAPLHRGRTQIVSAIAICVAAGSVAFLVKAHNSGGSRVFASVLASAALLLALDLAWQRFLKRNQEPASTARFQRILRIAADAVLLTPLIFVLPWHP